MTAGQPLAYRADRLPRAANRQRVELGFQHWRERLDRLADAELAQFCRALAEDSDGRALLEALFANSPFLTDCALADMDGLRDLLQRGPDTVLEDQIARVRAEADTEDADTCMRVLRQCRRRTALGAALADITDTWDLDQVTQALSAFADAAVDTLTIDPHKAGRAVIPAGGLLVAEQASLDALAELDVAALKIDRSFVTGIDDRPRERAIVRAVILMASELGLDTVAEGLERRYRAREALCELLELCPGLEALHHHPAAGGDGTGPEG